MLVERRNHSVIESPAFVHLCEADPCQTVRELSVLICQHIHSASNIIVNRSFVPCIRHPLKVKESLKQWVHLSTVIVLAFFLPHA